MVSALQKIVAIMMKYREGQEQKCSEMDCKKRRHFQQVLVGEDAPGRKDTNRGRGLRVISGTLGVIRLGSVLFA